MFELSVACKYLLPRRRQLSVSIISLISVFVIALVVWLIVVFFSVTNGLEKNWIQKLTALTAPVRLTPTEAYYHSYYYLIDTISDASEYSAKTISEKRNALVTDPYDPELDEEIPAYWPTPDRYPDGTIKDLVKLVDASLAEIRKVPGLQSHDFELTATHIHLHLIRNTSLPHAPHLSGGTTHSVLAYPTYLGNFEKNNPHLGKTLLPITPQDLNNLLYLMAFTNDETPTDSHDVHTLFTPEIVQKRLKNFFHFVTIKQLKSRAMGWTIPPHLYPVEAEWNICAIVKNDQVMRVIIPQQSSQCLSLQQTLEEQGSKVFSGHLVIKEGRLTLSFPQNQQYKIPPHLSLTLAGESIFPAQLHRQSIDHAKQISDLRFSVEIPIQGMVLTGEIPYRNLELAAADTVIPSNVKDESEERSPSWVYLSDQIEGMTTFVLPKDQEIGEAILVPKSFREAGIMVGDRGSLSYLSPTTSVLQEQLIPIYIAGFYDPGIIPIGGKFILANHEVTSLIRSSHSQEDKTAVTNGINIHFERIEQADDVKTQLLKALKKKGIHRYWNIETYREYEFTKEIMQELQSQKHLFMLIAVVIIVVACSNIISMLVILVNDKKTEIGILRSMGASSKNIALIFGMAGALIGVLGSVAGIITAILTLRHFDKMISLLSQLQGHEMFSTAFYGEVFPHELSLEALSFVLIATIGISLLAGIVPAIKACLLRPSHILRSSGG